MNPGKKPNLHKEPSRPRMYYNLLCYVCVLLVQMRLGNSSWSPTIAGLVLEHLCPTIQNILEDGLRDHKLDLIIGQRRNHSWSVVEVSTRIGTNSCTSFRGTLMNVHVGQFASR